MTAEKKHRDVPMQEAGTIHVITGNDDYLVNFQANQLINQFLTNDEKVIALETINGEINDASNATKTIGQLCEAIATGSFASSGKKVIWLKNAIFLENERILKSSEFTQAIDNFQNIVTRSIPSTHTVIITAPSISNKLGFSEKNVKTLKRYEFVIPTRPSQQITYAIQFIQKYVSSLHKEINKEAVTRLHEIVGLNTADLAREIDKLVTFVGDRKTIGISDTNAVCSHLHQVKSWDLLDAIGERNLKRALSIYKQCINQGENPIALITMIANRFRELLLLREALHRKWLVLKKYTGYTTAEWTQLPSNIETIFENYITDDPRTTHPYRLAKLTEQASRFTIAELKHAEHLIAKTYEKLLSSTISDELLIELLLIKIIPNSSNKNT